MADLTKLMRLTRLTDQLTPRNGVRTWLVGFWAYVMAHQRAPTWMSSVVVSFVFAVVSMPASILGNEAALKFGRHRAITAVMIASAAVAVLIGLNVGAGMGRRLPAAGLRPTVPVDSGARTADMSASRDQRASRRRAATLALHSTVGLRAVLRNGRGARFCWRATERRRMDDGLSSSSRPESRWVLSRLCGPAPARRKTLIPRNDRTSCPSTHAAGINRAKRPIGAPPAGAGR